MPRHGPMARCGLLLLVAAIFLLAPGGAVAQGTAVGIGQDAGRVGSIPFAGGILARSIPENSLIAGDLASGSTLAQGGAALSHDIGTGKNGSDNRSQQTVLGLLQQIDAAGVITLIDERGQPLRLFQASDAVITLDGRSVSLTEVPVGVLAVVTFRPGTGTLPAYFTRFRSGTKYWHW